MTPPSVAPRVSKLFIPLPADTLLNKPVTPCTSNSKDDGVAPIPSPSLLILTLSVPAVTKVSTFALASPYILVSPP